MNAASRRPAVVLLALMTVTLTACSADGPDGFCDSFASLEALNGELSAIGATDPEGAGAKLDEVTVALGAVEPPAEVADPFDVYADALLAYTDAAATALADLENVDHEAITAATQGMTSAEVGQARAELAGYTTEHCS
jgi:hypothetical protein